MHRDEGFSGAAVVLAFLAGAAAGAAVALMTAPKAGRDTREDVRGWARDTREKIHDRLDGTPDTIRDAYGRAADAARRAYDRTMHKSRPDAEVEDSPEPTPVSES